MNKERVQTLEALLTRVQRNAAEPRPTRAKRPDAAPIGAETRGAAAAKPVSDVVDRSPRRATTPTAQPKAAQPVSPASAAAAPAASPPKVTPRLIDPMAAPAEDPAKWTLDEFGSDDKAAAKPEPSPRPVAARVSSPAAQPKPAASRPVAPATPAAPSSVRSSGLAGFPRAAKSDPHAVPKPPASSPGQRPAATAALDAAKEPFVAAVLSATVEPAGGRRKPELASLHDESEEIEATVTGQVPDDILELSRAQRLPAAPAALGGIVEPAPRQESPRPQPVDTVRPPVALGGTMVMDSRSPPPLPPVDLTPPAPPPLEPATPPPAIEEPRAIHAEPPPAEPPAAELPPPSPRPVAPIESVKEMPAFSSGEVEAQPSKFAKEAGKPKQKGGSLTPYLVVAIVAVLAALGAFLYKRRAEYFGVQSLPAPQKTALPAAPSASSAPVTTAQPGATASAAAEASATASPEPTTSASAATSPDAPPKDPKTLAPTEGYVFVKSTLEGDVYAGGLHRLGASNQWLVTSCVGAQFLRLGRPKSNGPEWTSEGKAVPVPCQGQTKVELSSVPAAVPPPPPPPPTPL